MSDKPEALSRDRMIELVLNQPDIDSEDRKIFRELFHSKAMKKLLNQLLRESDLEIAKLAHTPLITEEDTNRARAIQGRAHGISQAVEILIDLMLPEDEKPEGEE